MNARRIDFATADTAKILTDLGAICRDRSGFYTLGIFAKMILGHVEKIAAEAMEDAEIYRVEFSQLQDSRLWEHRLDAYGDEIYRTGDGDVLAPTAEEVATLFANNFAGSHKNLPLRIFQIENKFRNEARARDGLIRTRQFKMLDAYSFDKDAAGMELSYEVARRAFCQTFDALGVEYRIESADVGQIGGIKSEEFVAKCDGRDVEIAHIFQLGDRYSRHMGASFATADNGSEFYQAGCYGIGITRLLQAIAAQQRDSDGLNFATFRLFDRAIVAVDADAALLKAESLASEGASVFLDDRRISSGRRAKDAIAFGIRDYEKI